MSTRCGLLNALQVISCVTANRNFYTQTTTRYNELLLT